MNTYKGLRGTSGTGTVSTQSAINTKATLERYTKRYKDNLGAEQ